MLVYRCIHFWTTIKESPCIIYHKVGTELPELFSIMTGTAKRKLGVHKHNIKLYEFYCGIDRSLDSINECWYYVITTSLGRYYCQLFLTRMETKKKTILRTKIMNNNHWTRKFNVGTYPQGHSVSPFISSYVSLITP